MKLTIVLLGKITFMGWIYNLPVVAAGQSNNDSTILARSYHHGKELYYNAFGPELRLYNGVYYREFTSFKNDDGQPYFDSKEWIIGDVFYDGILFENVPLLYDLVNDKLIVDHKYGAVKLELISQKVNYFVIKGHKFVRLATSGNQIQQGFYELLYDGPSKFYAKWQKSRLETVGTREVEVRYEDHNRFYIDKGSTFFQVRYKASVLNILQDKKTTLQKYIRKANLNFNTHRLESIISLLSFYDSGSTL